MARECTAKVTIREGKKKGSLTVRVEILKEKNTEPRVRKVMTHSSDSPFSGSGIGGFVVGFMGFDDMIQN